MPHAHCTNTNAPHRLQPLLNKRAFCHLKPSTIYGEPEQEKPFVQLNNGAAGDNDFDEKRNSALLVLKHQTESRGEYEVLFKQCINDKYVIQPRFPKTFEASELCTTLTHLVLWHPGVCQTLHCWRLSLLCLWVAMQSHGCVHATTSLMTLACRGYQQRPQWAFSLAFF